MATFTDDFNRADSTNVGASWVEVSGDWSIVSNRLSPGSAGGTIILRAATAMDSNDHYVQTTITGTTAASHGVWCRGNSNITQGYLFRNDGSTWDLFSVVSSTFTVIGTYSAAAAPGDVVKLQAVGSAIKGFINGVERVSVTNSAVTSGTSVGIRSQSTAAISFDDFAAADVVTGVTGDAALTGTATLTAAGQRGAAAESSLAASAALTAEGTRSTAGDTGLTLTTTLTATGTVTTSGTGAAEVTAALDAAGLVNHPGQGALSATAELTASAVRASTADATLGAVAVLEAHGDLVHGAEAALAAAASLTAAGATNATRSAALAATATVTASGTVSYGGPTVDIDITVGTPTSPWAAGPPRL